MHVLQLVTNDRAPFFRQQLESLEALGVTSDVITPNGTHSPSKSRSPRSYADLALRTVRHSNQQYDLVHANYGLTAPAALLQRQLPVVLSLWGSDLLGKFGPLSQFCARHSDQVIVMTQGMAETLGQPCHVIPHGVDLDRFRPLPATPDVGWDGDVNVLFPYDPERPVKDFPKARRVVEAVDERTDRTVTLRTLSGVAHDEMVRYYNAADVLLLTSKREGSPNVVKEALACNLPVVARAVGDVPERLDGLPVSRVCYSEYELIEGLQSVIDSDSQEDGRAAAAETSARRTAERIHRVYRTALAETGSQPDAVTVQQRERMQ